MRLALAFAAFTATVAAQEARSTGGSSSSWDPAAAAAYLDARMDLWFANGTKLRTGDTQTACVSCHAGLAYALSRPVLRRLMHVEAPSTQEARLIDETKRRVETYTTHQVLYDFNERRQAAMGPWKWSKAAPPVKSPGDLDTSLLTQSDGYATGLVVYTLKQAGVAPTHDAIRKGIRWLEANQRAIPVPDIPGRAWHAHSLNYDREHGGERRAVAAVVRVRHGDGIRDPRAG